MTYYVPFAHQKGQDAMTTIMRPRPMLALLIVGSWLALSLSPPGAWAAPSCGYDPPTHVVTVHLGAPGDAAIITVVGGSIAVNAVSCGATVADADQVVVVDDTAGGATSVSVDMSGGPFAPGFTDEPGASDEIEFAINLGDGAGDSLLLRGGPGKNAITAGADGANLNAAEADGVDPDVTFSGVESVTLEGAQSNDALSAGGGAGTGAPLALPAILNGGVGGDALVGGAGRDVFNGGEGFDTADYSQANDPLNISIGDGFANDGRAGEGDDVQSSVEAVLGGSGDDLIKGDASAELIDGGPGNDNLDGRNGDDEIHGGPGNDVLNGWENDDLLIGGPGDDQETGGGFNDLFVQTPQTVYRADAASPIADVGMTNSTMTVSGSPGRIYDINARVDIEHPATQHLKITLESPAGTRSRLSQNRGNGTSFRGTVFDSEAIVNIRGAGARPFEGRFHPDGSMELFDWEFADGTWTLEVVDSVSGSVGTVNDWQLEITFGSPDSDGNDLIDGKVGRDLLDYSGRTKPVTVTLAGGANDGQAGEFDNAGIDLNSVEDLYGGVNNDVLTGNAPSNEMRGMGGNDQLYGLAGPDIMRGGGGNDLLDGGDDGDTLNGGPGSDSIVGGNGVDWTAYTGAPTGVNVDLAAGTSSGGEGNDSISQVENVTGSGHNDVFTGNAGANYLYGAAGNDQLRAAAGNDNLEGGAGNDVIDGGAGVDWTRYSAAPGPVNVDLSAGTSSGGEGNDVISATENVSGSVFNDVLTGDGLTNYLFGDAGQDTLNGGGGTDYLEGRAGNDVIDGGLGNDWLQYVGAPSAVFVDLAAATVGGGDGSDTFTSIENVTGSRFADSLLGDGLSNRLYGGPGNDTIGGRAGNDFLDGGPNADSLDGGDGTDTCTTGETLASCEA